MEEENEVRQVARSRAWDTKVTGVEDTVARSKDGR